MEFRTTSEISSICDVSSCELTIYNLFAKKVNKMHESIPVTRSIKHNALYAPYTVSLTPGDLWVLNKTVTTSITTQLPDIRFISGHNFQFSQVVANILMFNRLDTKRMLIVDGREFLYFIEEGEVITIPSLPQYEGIRVVFTLSDVDSKRKPSLRVTFDNTITTPYSVSKKRKWFH